MVVERETVVACEPHDIVQITDETHPWYPALLIVGEVKPWGVQACALIPASNAAPKSCNQAWNRLKTGSFERVGRAVVVPGGRGAVCA